MANTALLKNMINFDEPNLLLVTKGNPFRTDGADSTNYGSGTELFPSLIFLSKKVIH